MSMNYTNLILIGGGALVVLGLVVGSVALIYFTRKKG
jgi:hypothetical protein